MGPNHLDELLEQIEVLQIVSTNWYPAPEAESDASSAQGGSATENVPDRQVILIAPWEVSQGLFERLSCFLRRFTRVRGEGRSDRIL